MYPDFKGIEQQERIASLKLDEIFVDLKAVPERTGGELATFERKRTPATKEELTETLIRQGILSRVFEFDGDGPIVARTSLSQFM